MPCWSSNGILATLTTQLSQVLQHELRRRQETVRLMASALGASLDAEAGMAGVAAATAPQYVDFKEQTRLEMLTIKQKMNELRSLHSKATLSKFDDTGDDDMQACQNHPPPGRLPSPPFPHRPSVCCVSVGSHRRSLLGVTLRDGLVAGQCCCVILPRRGSCPSMPPAFLPWLAPLAPTPACCRGMMC